MFDILSSSQDVDADGDFLALAAAIAAIPPAVPGGSALTAAAELRALTILQRRLAGVVLERLASFDAQGFALASGSASTAAWVRAYTNVTGPAASSMVAAARTTRTLPTLAAELTAGRIGVEHLQAVARSTQQVPDDVLAQHDVTLRDLAPHVTPAHLHRAGTKITEVWDSAAAADNVDHAEESRRLSISQTLNGVWALDGTLTPEAGAKLAAALEPLMRRRGPEDVRTAIQRRADALLELVEIALRSGDLPDCGGDRTRITLVVHATESALDLLQHHRVAPGSDIDIDDPAADLTRDTLNGHNQDEGYRDGADDDPPGTGPGRLLDVTEGRDRQRTSGGEGGARPGSLWLPGSDPSCAAALADQAPPEAPPPPRSRSGPPPTPGVRCLPGPANGLLLPSVGPALPGLVLQSAPPPPDGGMAGLVLQSAPLPADGELPDGVAPAGILPSQRKAAGLPVTEAKKQTGNNGLRSGPGAWLAGGRLAAVFGDSSSHRQLLGSHAELTIEALTRLGCDADLALAFMDVTGQPMYLSRTSRDPNTAQRRLLLIRDGGCVFPGCDRPPSHCQAHHLRFWTRDHGPTDIDNLALVCGFHHWLVHDKHWTLQALPVSRDAPAGGWVAQSPDGLTLWRYRQPAA